VPTEETSQPQKKKGDKKMGGRNKMKGSNQWKSKVKDFAKGRMKKEKDKGLLE